MNIAIFAILIFNEKRGVWKAAILLTLLQLLFPLVINSSWYGKLFPPSNAFFSFFLVLHPTNKIRMHFGNFSSQRFKIWRGKRMVITNHRLIPLISWWYFDVVFIVKIDSTSTLSVPVSIVWNSLSYLAEEVYAM